MAGEEEGCQEGRIEEEEVSAPGTRGGGPITPSTLSPDSRHERGDSDDGPRRRPRRRLRRRRRRSRAAGRPFVRGVSDHPLLLFQGGPARSRSIATATPSSSLVGSTGRPRRVHLRVGVAHHQAAGRRRSSISWSFQLSPMASVSSRAARPSARCRNASASALPTRGRSTSRMPTPVAGIDRALDARARAEAGQRARGSSAAIAAIGPAEHHLQRVLGQRRLEVVAPCTRRGATGRGSTTSSVFDGRDALDDQAALAAVAAVHHGIGAAARGPGADRAQRQSRGQGQAAQEHRRPSLDRSTSAPLCSTRSGRRRRAAPRSRRAAG